MVEKLEDILTRFGEKVAAGEQNTAGQGTPKQHHATMVLTNDGWEAELSTF